MLDVTLCHGNAVRGRWVAAAQDIPVGALVLESKPYAYVLSPSLWTERCQVCFQASSKLSRCGGCRLVYYCSKACQRLDWKEKHKIECPRLPSMWQHAAHPTALSDALMVTRVLRKEAARVPATPDPSASPETLVPSDMVWFEADRPEMHSIAAWLTSNHGSLLPDNATTQVVEEMLCRFHSNNFTITDELLLDTGAGCFPWGAMVNHSCANNCVITYAPLTQTMQLRAIEFIPKGAEITQPYVDVGLPLRKRQQTLQEHYHFACTCDRCTREGQLDEDDTLSDASKKAVLQQAAEWCTDAARATTAELAIELYHRALEARRRVVASEWDVLLLEIHAQLLTLHIEMGNGHDAIHVARKIYAFYQQLYHPNHPLTGLHLYTLGDLEWQCQEDGALLHLSEAWRILTITHGAGHSMVQTLQGRVHEMRPSS